MKFTNTEKAAIRAIVEEYAKGHNEAHAAYKAAFAAAEARLWHSDQAHKVTPQHVEALLTNMERSQDGGLNWALCAPRPLTVLDSFPKVTAAQRADLDAKVDALWRAREKAVRKLQRRLAEVLR